MIGFYAAGAMGAGGGGGGGTTQDFAFDPLDKRSTITLSNGDKTASTTDDPHFYAACTNPKNIGKWLFEFVIDSMPPTTGNIGIGMANVPADSNTIDWINPQVTTGFDWWVRKSAALSRFYYGGGASDYDALTPATDSFDTGDRVTCTVDFTTEEVKVYRNGSLIYAKTVASINTGTYSYAPVVKLWGTATPATVSIPSDIAHPVSGFAPWGP